MELEVNISMDSIVEHPIAKTINWFIDIPINVENFINKDIFSSVFTIDQKNVITKWKLKYNLDGKTDMIAASFQYDRFHYSIL